MWMTRLCLKRRSAPDGLGCQLGLSPVFHVSLTCARPLWLSLTTRLISMNYGNHEAERIFVTRRLRTQIQLKMGNVSFEMRWLTTRRNYMQDVTSAKQRQLLFVHLFFFSSPFAFLLLVLHTIDAAAIISNTIKANRSAACVCCSRIRGARSLPVARFMRIGLKLVKGCWLIPFC